MLSSFNNMYGSTHCTCDGDSAQYKQDGHEENRHTHNY